MINKLKIMIVQAKDTAIAMGSGNLSVLSTPSMVAWMEGSAAGIASKMCESGQTTVGTMLHIEHLRATALGAEVYTSAKLVSQDGRKLVFEVEASDEKGIIGRGTHERFIVDRQKFMSKL